MRSREPFRWKRKRNGYEVVHGVDLIEAEFGTKLHLLPGVLHPDALKNAHLFLTEKASVRSNQAECFIPGIENPALFREAANLDESPESLAAFSNRWGLFCDPSEFARCSPNELSKLTRTRMAEKLALGNLWPKEFQGRIDKGIALFGLWRLRLLKWSVAAWDAYDSNSSTRIRRFFRQTPQGKWALNWVDQVAARHLMLTRATVRLKDLVTSQEDIVILIESERPRFREVLLMHILDLVNEQLEEVSRPTLFRNEDDKIEMRFVPRQLEGFLWAQFAEAIAGGKKYKPCAVCGAWMGVSPGLGRPEKKTCSDKCRQRAYRKRKDKSLKRR